MRPTHRTGRRVPAALAAVCLAAVCLAACTGSLAPSALDQGARTVDPDALATSGCREVEAGDVDDRYHLEPDEAPPASELYDTAMPATGPHFGRWSPVIDELPATPMDARALLHNMEHGAVVVWVDPDLLDTGALDFIEDWRGQLGAAGFDNEETGAAVFVSRFPGTADRPDVAVAYRAWGVALDCTGWDLDVADAFVGLNYGTRGAAPESELGPWPSGNGVLVGPPGIDDGTTTTV